MCDCSWRSTTSSSQSTYVQSRVWRGLSDHEQALLIASFTLGQSFYYKRAPDQRLSSTVKTGLTVLGMLSAASALLSAIGTLQWLDFFNVLALVKLVISAVKVRCQPLVRCPYP
jgi:hypothetical protein